MDPLNWSFTMAVLTAIIHPAPIACSMRTAIRKYTFMASPHAMLAAMYRLMPAIIVGLRPILSEIGPNTRIPSAKNKKNTTRVRFMVESAALK